jgi:hypothetical protein
MGLSQLDFPAELGFRLLDQNRLVIGAIEETRQRKNHGPEDRERKEDQPDDYAAPIPHEGDTTLGRVKCQCAN